MANAHEISPPYAEERHAFVDALAGLILGLISVCGSFVAIVGLVCGVLGLYFNVLARGNTLHRAMGGAGLTLSIIGTVLGAIITTWWVIAATMGFGWTIVMHGGWMEVFR